MKDKRLTLEDILDYKHDQYEEYCSQFIHRVYAFYHGASVETCEKLCPLYKLFPSKYFCCEPQAKKVKKLIIRKFPLTYINYLEKEE